MIDDAAADQIIPVPSVVTVLYSAIIFVVARWEPFSLNSVEVVVDTLNNRSSNLLIGAILGEDCVTDGVRTDASARLTWVKLVASVASDVTLVEVEAHAGKLVPVEALADTHASVILVWADAPVLVSIVNVNVGGGIEGVVHRLEDVVGRGPAGEGLSKIVLFDAGASLKCAWVGASIAPVGARLRCNANINDALAADVTKDELFRLAVESLLARWGEASGHH